VPVTLCGVHANVPNGLYFWFFSNESDEDVWDNNRGREKVIIRKRGRSVRPGKFEAGRTGLRTFLRRVQEYDDHLHHLPHAAPLAPHARVLRNCVVDGWLLDLSEWGPPSLALETEWIRESLGYLRQCGWTLERARRVGRRAAKGEWHHVIGAGQWRSQDFETHLRSLGQRIIQRMRTP
jgi:hypothetical protein